MIPTGADSTPLDPKSQTLYQSIVGSILYAALTTRPDVAHAVAELSRFNCEATQYHLTAARHTLRYLAGTTNHGLIFKLTGSPSDIIPEIYVDASWGDDLEKRNSTTGVVVKLNGNVICWNTRKQKTVALSSTEAEYMALTDATTEALWLRTWINEVFRKNIPILIHCDNQSAIALASNDTFHQRTKHIDIRYHFIRQHVQSGDIKIKWIQTENQQADILTKRINGKRFIVLREQLMTAI
jgi:Reverse transcriptase-like